MLVRDIGARGSDALPVTVAADGEVSVGPEPIGHLTGFEFRVDPSARLADKRLLLAAAERRLGEELDRRAKALVEADDHGFQLTVEDGGGVAVAWEGHVLARLAPGRSLLEPALRTARALDRLSAPTRAALRERLERWVEAQIDRHLRPLKQLAAAAGRSGEQRQESARSRQCWPTPGACFRARRRSAPSPISNRPTARRCTACAFASVRSTFSCRCCSSPPPSTGAPLCSPSARVSRCRRCRRRAPPR